MLTFNFDPFPVLETERLLLRNVAHEDAENLFRMRTDKETMKYINRPLPTSIEDAYKLIEKIHDGIKNNQAIGWAIALKNEPQNILGSIGFHYIEAEHHRAEIGYLIEKDHWRKGYTHEAIQKVIEYGFKDLKFHSLEAHINPENIPSARILEKNNFVREGYFRENYFYNGSYLDSAVYSLINPYSKK